MVGVFFLILFVCGIRTRIKINGKTYSIHYEGVLSKKEFNKTKEDNND